MSEVKEPLIFNNVTCVTYFDAYGEYKASNFIYNLIEKSAYDSLAAEIEQVKKERDELRSLTETQSETLWRMQNSLDKLNEPYLDARKMNLRRDKK